ncbi:MAG TPA: hypothetical protein VND19_11570 [Acetobacteraceae bacterium]|nr:hypothetical protein [Acetobacteraceae bacterium]
MPARAWIRRISTPEVSRHRGAQRMVHHLPIARVRGQAPKTLDGVGIDPRCQLSFCRTMELAAHGVRPAVHRRHFARVDRRT